MPHDHRKQCLDDSIVVDTSNAALAGWITAGAWSCATNERSSIIKPFV
jgi:hypothetical protein